MVQWKMAVFERSLLGGGFKYFLFSPLFGEDFQFDQYFSDGLKPPTSMYIYIIISQQKVKVQFLPSGPISVSF